MVRSFTTLAAGCAALALAACGDNLTAGPFALTIDPAAASVPVGRELVLHGLYLDDLGAERPALDLVWTSNAPSVATVTPGPDGVAVLRGVGRGSVVITAQGSGLDGAALITVRGAEVDALALLPAEPLVPTGTCATVTALASMSDGVMRELEGTSVFWFGTTGRIAVGGDGTICGISKGPDVLHARFGDVTVDAPVEVIDAVPERLQMQLQFGLTVGDQVQARAMLIFSDGQSQNVTSSASWTGGPAEVATVSESGLVTAVGEGEALIGASFSGFTVEQAVQVFAAPLIAIEVTPDHPSLVVGATRQLTATAVFSNGTRLDVTTAATWFSGSPTVAAVSETGLVTALAPGASVVSAELDFRRGAVFVDVGF